MSAVPDLQTHKCPPQAVAVGWHGFHCHDGSRQPSLRDFITFPVMRTLLAPEPALIDQDAPVLSPSLYDLGIVAEEETKLPPIIL